MVNRKRFVTGSVLAGAFGLGLFATSSFASGPLVLGPTSAPVMPKLIATPAVHASMQAKALNTYRQIRGFWLSRAIVR